MLLNNHYVLALGTWGPIGSLGLDSNVLYSFHALPEKSCWRSNSPNMTSIYPYRKCGSWCVPIKLWQYHMAEDQDCPCYLWHLVYHQCYGCTTFCQEFKFVAAQFAVFTKAVHADISILTSACFNNKNGQNLFFQKSMDKNPADFFFLPNQ